MGRGYMNISVYLCIDECTLKESTAVIRTSFSLQAVDYKEGLVIDEKLMELEAKRNKVNLISQESSLTFS